MSRDAPLVVKFGGELVEEGARLAAVVGALARIHGAGAPLVVVHGGGREIDAALRSAGLDKRQVDGLRITDAATLGVVVSIVAGIVNTRVVAALATAGLPAVGLTGADARCGLSDPAPPHRSADGRTIDLGLVGVPSDAAEPRLITALVDNRFVPVLACIGLGRDGGLLNVNADTLAGRLAGRLGARRLVIAGATAGVLDDRAATLPRLDPAGIERVIAGGTATAGMVAKLRACADALAHGVGDVVIVDGRDPDALVAAALDEAPPGATRITGAGLGAAGVGSRELRR